MDRALTLLHIESHNQWAGQERRVVTECRWMADQGHRVHLAAPPNTPVSDRARAAGISVHPIRFLPRTLPSDLFRVRRLIRRLQPDVINPHGNRDGKAALLAAAGLHVSCVIRSRHVSIPVRNTRYNRLLYGRLCHRVFTTSRKSAAQLVRDLGIPAERVHFVPSGIVPPAVLPDRNETRRALAAAWGLPETGRWIGFVGRLSAEKGISLLITALARLAAEMSDLRLVLVGRGGEAESLRVQARAAGVADRVILTGFQEDPWPWHRALDVEVLPSLCGEGVPQSVLEAMHAGCPVIGSWDGGIPDIVRHGETGLLFPVGDAEELTQALRSALADPAAAAQRAETARGMVADRHTIHAMGRQILDIYQQVRNGGC